MTTQQIKELLEKYFAGDTSLDEEQTLRHYFTGRSVAPELQTYRPLFAFFEKAREEQLHPAFEDRLIGQLDRGSQPTARIRPMYAFALRIAAAVALLIGLYFLVPLATTDHHGDAMAINWDKYEPASEEIALEETKAALKLLATKLNRCAKAATAEINKMEKVSKPLK